MSNPAPDFPAAYHAAIDTSDFSARYQGATLPTHPDMHGKIEEELENITKRLHYEAVSVLEFGAVGDGARVGAEVAFPVWTGTDNRAFIQNAINAACESWPTYPALPVIYGPRKVIFPAGFFVIDSPLILQRNVELVGAGPWATWIIQRGTGPVLRFPLNVAENQMGSSAPVDNVCIAEMTLHGNLADTLTGDGVAYIKNDGAGETSLGVNYFRMRNVQIFGCGRDSIHIEADRSDNSAIFQWATFENVVCGSRNGYQYIGGRYGWYFQGICNGFTSIGCEGQMTGEDAWYWCQGTNGSIPVSHTLIRCRAEGAGRPKEVPGDWGVEAAAGTGGTTTATVLDVDYSVAVDDFYNGWTLTVAGESPVTITDYDGDTLTATHAAISGAADGKVYTIDSVVHGFNVSGAINILIQNPYIEDCGWSDSTGMSAGVYLGVANSQYITVELAKIGNQHVGVWAYRGGYLTLTDNYMAWTHPEKPRPTLYKIDSGFTSGSVYVGRGYLPTAGISQGITFLDDSGIRARGWITGTAGETSQLRVGRLSISTQTISNGTATPTDGHFTAGHLRLNSAVAAGGDSPAWSCITTGAIHVAQTGDTVTGEFEITDVSVTPATGWVGAKYYSGTGQATGNDTTHIKLASGESATTDFFLDGTIEIVGGPGTGQTSFVTAYNGTTKIATISPAWAVATDDTSLYKVSVPGDHIVATLGGVVKTAANTHVVYTYGTAGAGVIVVDKALVGDADDAALTSPDAVPVWKAWPVIAS